MEIIFGHIGENTQGKIKQVKTEAGITNICSKKSCAGCEHEAKAGKGEVCFDKKTYSALKKVVDSASFDRIAEASASMDAERERIAKEGYFKKAAAPEKAGAGVLESQGELF